MNYFIPNLEALCCLYNNLYQINTYTHMYKISINCPCQIILNQPKLKEIRPYRGIMGRDNDKRQSKLPDTNETIRT